MSPASSAGCPPPPSTSKIPTATCSSTSRCWRSTPDRMPASCPGRRPSGATPRSTSPRHGRSDSGGRALRGLLALLLGRLAQLLETYHLTQGPPVTVGDLV